MRRHAISAASLAVLLMAVAGCPRSGDKLQAARRQPSEIIFSHALHMEAEVGCETCHGEVTDAESLAGNYSPKKEICAECHDVEDEENCSTCHTDLPQAKKLPRLPSTERLLFAHETHLERVPGEGAEKCRACHAETMNAKTLDGLARPKMREHCLEGCHNHMEDYRALRCTLCHESLSRFPIKFISEFNHEGNFLHEHGHWAKSQSDMCFACHTQTYCAQCHSRRAELIPSVKFPENVNRQYIHRGDWISRHAVASRADPQICTRCHASKDCLTCHDAMGISSRAAGIMGSNGRSPHPPGWMNPGSPNSHGIEARRHITQCASCHDRGAQSNCVRCHKARSRGGLGINPHPPGWDRGGKQSKEMCQICH